MMNYSKGMIILLYMLTRKNCGNRLHLTLPNKRMVYVYGVYVRKGNDRRGKYVTCR